MEGENSARFYEVMEDSEYDSNLLTGKESLSSGSIPLTRTQWSFSHEGVVYGTRPSKRCLLCQFLGGSPVPISLKVFSVSLFFCMILNL